MGTKVKVENFQSIQGAEVEIDGLTVITGPNNSGKTALMRAIQGVFTNTPGVAFVRRGQDQTTVEVEFEDGSIVKWEKGSKIKPTYTINNGKPIQPGRGVPDEVSDLNVRSIQAGNQDLWPQIAPQIRGQVFLIDKPGSTIAEAVADVERVGTLNGSMRLAEKDLRSTRSTLKIRRQDELDLTEELAGFDGFEDVETKVEELEKEHKRLAKISKVVTTLRDLHTRRQKTTGEIEALEGIKEIQVPSDDLVEGLRDLREDAQALQGLKDRYDSLWEEVETLQGAGEIQVPSDDPVDELRDLRTKIRGLSDLKDRYDSAQEEVDTLQGADKLSDLSLSEGRLPKIWEAFKVVADLRKRRKAIQEAIKEAREELAEAEADLKEAQEEVDDLLVGLDECPTCGAETHG